MLGLRVENHGLRSPGTQAIAPDFTDKDYLRSLWVRVAGWSDLLKPIDEDSGATNNHVNTPLLGDDEQ